MPFIYVLIIEWTGPRVEKLLNIWQNKLVLFLFLVQIYKYYKKKSSNPTPIVGIISSIHTTIHPTFHQNGLQMDLTMECLGSLKEIYCWFLVNHYQLIYYDKQKRLIVKGLKI